MADLEQRQPIPEDAIEHWYRVEAERRARDAEAAAVVVGAPTEEKEESDGPQGS